MILDKSLLQNLFFNKIHLECPKCFLSGTDTFCESILSFTLIREMFGLNYQPIVFTHHYFLINLNILYFLLRTTVWE